MKRFVHFGNYTGFKAAGIDTSKPVQVYRNLHRKCWSVRQDGIVKAHCESVELINCQMVVQPAGRAKVLREKKKNVHAYVKGYISLNQQDFSWPTKLWYNPYEAGSFLSKRDSRDDAVETTQANRVTLGSKGASCVGVNFYN